VSDLSRYDRLTMFRAAALQGMALSTTGWGFTLEAQAKSACDLADAMMAECDKRDREGKGR